MKRLLLALAIFLLPSIALAQCNGVFAPNTVCGNATGSTTVPRPTSPSSFTVGAGGINGQIQYNNAGAFGGFTPGGDLSFSNPNFTINPLAVTPSKIANKTGNGANIPTSTGTLTANDCVKIDANGNFVDSGAGCNISSTIFIQPTDATYGAKCDGVTDDHVALQNWLNAIPNKIGLIGAYTCLTSTTLTVSSNTTIKGLGWNSVIKTTATTGVFNLTNVSFVQFNNFEILGSDNWTTQPTSSYGPVTLIQNSSATTAGSGYDFQNMKFAGFNTTFWFYISAAGSTHPLGNLNISNNWFASTAADAPADNAGHNGNNGAIEMFSGSGGNGQLHDITINNNRMDATAFCFGAFFGGYYLNYQAIGNYITNIGASVPAHCNNSSGATINAYAIAVYDTNNDGFIANRGLIAANTILQPYASGIYLAGVGSITTSVVGNYIYGQVSSDDALLPRAAISINTYTDILVQGNYLYQGYGGVVATGETSGTISIIGNDCVTTAGSSFCIKQVAGTGTTGNTDHRLIRGNTVNAGVNGVWTVSSSGAEFYGIDISGNTIVGGTTALNLSSPFVVGALTITGNTIQSGNTPISIGSVTGNIQLSANAIFNTTSGASGLTFATLPGSAAIPGSQVYVSDATAGSSPCTGSGSGATAIRQGGAWKCF